MTLSQEKFCPLGNIDWVIWVMCGDSLGGGGGNIVLAIDLVGDVRGAAHSVYTAVMTELFIPKCY